MKPRSNTRDVGLTGDSHGAGKGDKSRITDIRTYRENFSDIDFSKSTLLFVEGNDKRKIKRYGKS